MEYIRGTSKCNIETSNSTLKFSFKRAGSHTTYQYPYIQFNMKYIIKAAAISAVAAISGIAVVAGEFDDSPGLSGLGLIGLIAITVYTYKQLNK